MSEVKRYDHTNGGSISCNECYMDAHPMGDYVKSADYDAAQSELAALRAEVTELSNTTGAAMFLMLTSELAALREKNNRQAERIVEQAQDNNKLSDELAALREELAASRKNTELAQESMQLFAIEADGLEQRLADAERRNAELIGVLEMFADNSDDGDVVELSRYHIALTKPEEAKS